MCVIKVLEIISDTNIGGAGVLLYSRLKYSDRSKFKTWVVLPKNSKLKKRMIAENIRCIEMNRCKDSSFDVKGIFELINIIKKYRPDIINTHACMSARIAAMLCNVPIRIYTRHCAFPVSRILRIPLTAKISGRVHEMLSTQMIAVAYAAKENLMEMGIASKKIKVIINGVEGITELDYNEKVKIRSMLGFGENDIVVGVCARLEKCKDHECFLKAAKLLSDTADKYKFIIIGDGGLRAELEAMTRRLKLSNIVRFIGFVEDVTPYLNILDIQVNCSVGTETSSLALSEGMSIGLPSVASDFGGNPYMIEHGVNGLLYERGNPRELALAISKIANNSDIYEYMSIKAKERFHKELNIDQTVRKTEGLYMELYKKLKNKK